jgi:glycosyltransferase involved in cell wall biosynthesis
VVLDGSTDNTESEIASVNDERIHVVKHTIQLGKATRLNELFQKNTSEYLVIFDADILIKDTDVIHKMIQPFTDARVGLVSANNLPISPREFIGKIWYRAEMVWYEMRKYADDAKTLYNNSGCSIAIRNDIAKKIILPRETIADQQFVYIQAMLSGGAFFYQKNANVYYHPPSTLKDISIQYPRSTTEEPFFQKHFGRSYDSFFTIPKWCRFKGLFDSLIADPLYTILAVSFLKLLPYTSTITLRETKKGLWPVTSSTKRRFHI